MITIRRDYKKEKEIDDYFNREKCNQKFEKTKQFDWCKKDNEIRNILKKYTDNRCTYCGIPISSGEIDHLYPKIEFPSKAYKMNNFFISCSECNRTRPKSERDFISVLKNNIFFRPDSEDYKFYKYYKPNFKDGTIEVREDIDSFTKLKAENTINIVIKLNRDTLKEARKEAFRKAMYGNDKEKLLQYSRFSYFFEALIREIKN